MVLYYNVDVTQRLEPGLYIPPYESIRQIEYSTLKTMADLRASKGVTIEDGVLDFAYEKLDLPRVRGKLLADVAKSVKGILNWNYVNVNNIEAPRLIGVHKYFKKSPFRT